MPTNNRVLLIEDDPVIVDLYATKMKLMGYKLAVASNGKAALLQLPIFRPDVILLDLLMPVMSGEKFLEKLRENSEYRDVPVIILTNVSRSEAPYTLWHLDISGYFIKAHNTPANLVKLVEQTLTQS